MRMLNAGRGSILFPLFVMVVLALATAALFVHAQQPTGYFLAIFLEEDEAGVEVLSPVDGLHVQREESILFKAHSVGTTGTYYVRLYVRKGSEPDVGEDSEDLVTETTVRSSQTFMYTHIPTPAWESGTYYWNIIFENVETGERLASGVQQYYVSSLSDVVSAIHVDAGSTTEIGSCDGGPGGHESDSTGEKTYMGFTLEEGRNTYFIFNKAERHGIGKIVLHAEKKLEPNGLIIHQEFEEETDYSLPRVDAVYKTIHIHQTDPWDEDAFYATLFFRVPKAWIEEKGRKRDEVHIQRYENGVWSPTPTFFEREENGYYVYQSTLHGLPPFAIGACHKTRQGRIIQGT